MTDSWETHGITDQANALRRVVRPTAGPATFWRRHALLLSDRLLALRVGVALPTVVHKVQVKVICHHHTAESAPR